MPTGTPPLGTGTTLLNTAQLHSMPTGTRCPLVLLDAHWYSMLTIVRAFLVSVSDCGRVSGSVSVESVGEPRGVSLGESLRVSLGVSQGNLWERESLGVSQTV